LTNILYKSET